MMDGKNVLNWLNVVKSWFNSQSTGYKWGIAGLASLLAGVGYNLVTRFYRRYVCHYPPGLIGVPYFGSFLSMLMYSPEYFNNTLLPSYGPLSMHKFGSVKILTIHDYNLVKAIFCSDHCFGRPPQISAMFPKNSYDRNNNKMETNFAFCNLEWKSRHALMRNGITAIARKDFLEPQLLHLLNKNIYPTIESSKLDDHDNNNNNNKFIWYSENIKNDLVNIGFNIVFGALFGKEKCLSLTSEEYKKLVDTMNKSLELIGPVVLAEYFYVPSFMLNDMRNKVYKGYEIELNIVGKYIDIAKKNYKNGVINNLFDQLYSIYKSKVNKDINNEKGIDYSNVTQEMFESDLFELFLAAMETTSGVLLSCLMYGARYPKLQDEIFEEISQFSVKDDHDDNKIRFDSSKFTKCVKFRAFINEVLRIGVNLPKGLPRQSDSKINIKYDINKQTGKCENIVVGDDNDNDINNSKREYSYTIDKSFVIEANFAYILTNSNHDEKEFDIYRWINKNKKEKEKDGELKFVSNNQLTVFSIGKRKCIGEVIARKSLAVIIANLFLNYKIESKMKDYQFEFEYTYDFIGRKIKPVTHLILTKR